MVYPEEEAYYKQLIGGKIIDAGLSEEEGEVWPFFTIEKNGETFKIEVSQDEEGNGAGYLFGLPS